MMDFEQRRAEVLRRGQARSRARKRRKRILLCCVPVLLCAGLLLWPDMEAGENLETQESAGLPEGIVLAKIVSVSGETVQYTETESVDALVSLLEAIKAEQEMLMEAEKPDSESESDFPEAGNQSLGYGAAETEICCISICLTDADGAMAEYELRGGVLTDRDTGAQYLLSEPQWDALLAAVGVTE